MVEGCVDGVACTEVCHFVYGHAFHIPVQEIGDAGLVPGVGHALEGQNGVPEVVAHAAGVGKVGLLGLKLFFLDLQDPDPLAFGIQRHHGHDDLVKEEKDGKLQGEHHPQNSAVGNEHGSLPQDGIVGGLQADIDKQEAAHEPGHNVPDVLQGKFIDKLGAEAQHGEGQRHRHHRPEPQGKDGVDGADLIDLGIGEERALKGGGDVAGKGHEGADGDENAQAAAQVHPHRGVVEQEEDYEHRVEQGVVVQAEPAGQVTAHCGQQAVDPGKQQSQARQG